MKRNYESGALKRRKQKEECEKQNMLLDKLPKLTTFFSRHSPQTTCDTFETADAQNITSSSISTNSASVVNEIGSAVDEENREDTAKCYTSNEEVRQVNDDAELKIPVTDVEQEEWSSDPALWPPDKTAAQVHWARKMAIPDQNISDNNFQSSKRAKNSDLTARYCSLSYFTFVSKNGETRKREWLIYSPSTGNIFCFFCALFGDSKDTFRNGYCDWAHGHRYIRNHEKSDNHVKCAQNWVSRVSSSGKIDTLLNSQVDEQKHYWKEVLRRVVETLKFLCDRGLALRGDSENINEDVNGNFLATLEYLSKFDPFMAQHLETRANQGRGHTSYISSTIYEEVIILMGKKVLQVISDEVKHSKYFSIIVDSSRDTSHVDQLAIILRYVAANAQVEERFIGFEASVGHKGKEIATAVLKKLKNLGLDIKDARGQSYDNASNMSGKFEGLQAHLRKECKYIDYVPCTAHSLNLVGHNTVENCETASEFFTFVQLLYNFCAASTHRWERICSALKSANGRNVALQSLSGTRWSARASSTKVLYENYNVIYHHLKEMTEDMEEKVAARSEARVIMNKMESLDFAFMTVLWNRILQRFDTTSAKLQEKALDLSVAVDLLKSLVAYVGELRNGFDGLEATAQSLSPVVDQQYRCEKSRQQRRKLASDETRQGEVILVGRERFRVESFIPIMDKLDTCLKKRLKEYEATNKIFGFLTYFKSMSDSCVLNAAKELCVSYPDDLDESFPDEMTQFSKLVQKDQTPPALECLKIIRDHKLESVFPNVDVAFRIYLSLPVANCSAERAFSKMSRVKNEIRSSMKDERLNALCLLTIERTLLRRIHYDDIISDFAAVKARKVPI